MSDRIILWQALIPGGQAETAESLARVSFPSTGADREASALLVTAAALLCAGQREERLLRSVEQRAGAITELRASAVLLYGLLAELRGQRDTARLLLESVEQFDPSFFSPFHRQLAAEWLIGEALDRGDAARAKALQQWSWLAPSTHTELTPWLRRIWPAAFTPTGTVAKERAPWTTLTTSLQTALAAHVRVFGLPEKELVSGDLERLALAWRNALRDPLTREHLQRRSTALGEPDLSRLLALLHEQLREDFVQLLRAPAMRWGDVLEISDPLIEALQLVRQEALHELEAGADRLLQRVEEKRALPMPAEWIDWNVLRAAYERLVGAGEAEDRRLAFAALHRPAGNFAVWLANEREQHPVANAIFRWLLREATAVGDQSAIALQKRNTEATRGA